MFTNKLIIMKKRFYIISTTIFLFLCAIAANAQIVYTNDKISINGASTNNIYGLEINDWNGMYWTCKNQGCFFLLDVSSTHPCIAGTGDQIVFYNSQISRFNSIQVSNVYYISDARAKKNIEPLQNGFNSIMKLRPVTYKWKSRADIPESVRNLSTQDKSINCGNDNTTQYGFLAQEVEQIVPDAVITDEEGHKLINYTAIIPMLVQAVQELQMTVEKQKEEIDNLLKQIDESN